MVSDINGIVFVRILLTVSITFFEDIGVKFICQSANLIHLKFTTAVSYQDTQYRYTNHSEMVAWIIPK